MTVVENRADWRINCGLIAGLLLLTSFVFMPVAHDPFVNYDDGVYVAQNPQIQAGMTWRGVVAAFTQPHARNWHPLTTLTHMLDCRLYGLNAGSHHATNVVLHSIAVLLLFR